MLGWYALVDSSGVVASLVDAAGAGVASAGLGAVSMAGGGPSAFAAAAPCVIVATTWPTTTVSSSLT